MLVPDEVQKCVVFLGLQRPTGDKEMIGTGFLFGVALEDDSLGAQHTYLVTARHVIDAIRREGIARTVHMRFNTRDGAVGWQSVSADQWVLHPAAPRKVDTTVKNVDVAVLPWRHISPDIDLRVIQTDMVVTDEVIKEEGITIGCEVFLPSLFIRHHGRQRNVPVLRTGHLSVMPPELIQTPRMGRIEAYLAEIRSVAGTSGAPVFVSLPYFRIIQGQQIQAVGQRMWMLLGLMHGHWDLEYLGLDSITPDGLRIDKLNTGIAGITPAVKIVETIMQHSLAEERSDVEKAIAQKLATTPDGAISDLTRKAFRQVLRKVAHPTDQEPDDQDGGHK
jgi:hypothetical protein